MGAVLCRAVPLAVRSMRPTHSRPARVHTQGQGVFVEVTDQAIVEFPVLRNVHIIAMASNRALCVFAPRLEQTDTMLVCACPALPRVPPARPSGSNHTPP